MRAEGDGYKRAPFLEPFVATVLTAALGLAMFSSGALVSLRPAAQAAPQSTPFSDAKAISFGVLNGCIPIQRTNAIALLCAQVYIPLPLSSFPDWCRMQ